MIGRAREAVLTLVLSTAPLTAMAAPPQRDACTDARNEGHARAQARYSKDARDAQTARNDALRACGDSSPCKRQAGEQYTERMKQVIQALDHEKAEVYKREVDCRLEAKLKRGQSAQKPESPSANDTEALYKLRAEIDGIRGNLLDNVLAAGDQFFKGLLDWGSGLLQFLAQPSGSFTEFGEPLKQIVDYLVNHKPESFAQQYERAQKAVEEFKQNPARMFGQQLPNFVPLPGAEAAAQVRAAATAAQRLARVNAAANRFLPTARKLLTPTTLPKGALNIVPPPLAGGPLRPPPSAAKIPSVVGTSPNGPRRGIPPTCYENQCWRNVQAVDHYWQTGEWIEPTPRGYPLAEELSDLGTPKSRIIQDLRQKYGGPSAKDPLQGPLGQRAHAHGIPVEMTKADIDDAMRAMGPGAQGYVFVSYERPVGSEIAQGSHVVGVRTLPDLSLEYFDRATLGTEGLRGAVEPELWQYAKSIFFYRTK